MDPVEDARALVSQRFPAALAAFLGGGVLSASRTPTSDLDIVVVLAGPPAPFRESLHWRGWPVELFVHTLDSLGTWFAKDTARRRPSLARMCADGVTLPGTQDHTSDAALAEQMVAAIGNPGRLAEAADEVLSRAGGRFWAGPRLPAQWKEDHS